MAKKKAPRGGSGAKTADYRYTREKRTNIPPAKIAAEGTVPSVPRARYHYNPHLPPALRFDPSGAADKLPALIAEAGRRPLGPEEQKLLVEALRQHDPWLEWATKREQHNKDFFDVDPVALHIHERVSAQAIVRAAMREDVQRSLFADPQQPYQQAVQFYRHDMDWTNRLILGDCLQVMSSLARRENLAGKVQMIYIDPPYGIKFSSNFQPEVRERDVRDRDSDLTREAETVKAYRDTWNLGVHSYLSYLRDRFFLSKELLADSGSIFVQISDENLHHVRELMDEVFGRENFCSVITFAKTSGQTDKRLASVSDYLVWYARSRERMKYRQLYHRKNIAGLGSSAYRRVLLPSGEVRTATGGELAGTSPLPQGARLFRLDNLTSQSPGSKYPVAFQGQTYQPKGYWKTEEIAMPRLLQAERVDSTGNENLYYVRFMEDFAAYPMADNWTDTVIAGFASAKKFVVETSAKVIERCVLMTTDPGDLVLDPTCGGGTTAYVAEEWGRRWITIDTSRVALAIARQRLLTARLPYYELRAIGPDDMKRNPDGAWLTDPAAAIAGPCTLSNKRVAHITLSSIAQNRNLDPIFEKYEGALDETLRHVNAALMDVKDSVRTTLREKLGAKERTEGKRAITEADRRRWLLPGKGEGWEQWAVPYDTDVDWPGNLSKSVIAYRRAWREKMDAVNACIEANAEQEELLYDTNVVSSVVRVSGPFTVEGVRPAELGLDSEGLFGGAPEEVTTLGEARGVESQNLHAYLAKMVQCLRADGLTFLNNQRRTFARIEPLFETSTGTVLHAEGIWAGGDERGPSTVAISFGPQYGPVTAGQVEDLIRASKRYDELVIAGFSFDAEASAVIQEASHPKLRVHQAYIRPDVNAAMEGLLKDSPNSQLFTVFGQPEIDLKKTKDGGLACVLEGVDIYDPIANVVRSTGAEKVAAWFLDSDYDGRCFCATQAFFPDQDAWDKLAKALGSTADTEAFEAFKGTTSLPFKAGTHKRIAVKVIDPRGNEVMTVRSLKG